MRMATLCLFFSFAIPQMNAFSAELPIYVGTYTGGESKGIYLLHFDTNSGVLSMKGVAAETSNPSFVALHPNGKFLYAVNETGTGELSSFAIEPDTGLLKLINEKPSGGGAPCHLVVDESGRNLLVANYSGGSVTVTRINLDGSLGDQSAFIQHVGSSINTNRQTSPHAHSINLDQSNHFAVAADLGIDQLLVYKFDPADGTLAINSAAKLSPGSGPRHFVFHPTQNYAYAINELSSEVSAFKYMPDRGLLQQMQTITTLPRDYAGEGNSTAEIRVSADGKFVYGSNRGHDSIAVFRVNQDGTLTAVQIQKIGGKTPRNFNLDPTGRFLLAAAQGSGVINVFSVDANTGKLSATGNSVQVPSPVCIRFATQKAKVSR